MAIVCLILGIMLAMQFKANESSPRNLSADRWMELTVQLDNLRREKEFLAEEVLSLRDKLKDTASGQQEMQSRLLKKSWTRLIGCRARGGSRSWVIVTLNDSQRLLQPKTHLYLIHAEDVLKVLNELKGAGRKP